MTTVVITLTGATTATAATIAYTDALGRQWRQVTETTGLSWNDANSVCSGGLCFADFGSFDLTGWTWASATDVASLFNEFIQPATGTPFTGLLSEANSSWAPLFLGTFAPTDTSPANFVGGWTSTPSSNLAMAAFLVDFTGLSSDIARVTVRNRALSDPAYGLWLYQVPAPTPVAPIPEPATLLLVGLGAAGLAVRKRFSRY
jgi:hypothetical protein